MVGWLVMGFFVAVVCAYACTEFLLVRLEMQRRILDRGVRTLVVILAANLASFALVCGVGIAILLATGAGYYLYATLVCVCAQALWLGQHLWAYYRDHPRLHYEQ